MRPCHNFYTENDEADKSSILFYRSGVKLSQQSKPTKPVKRYICSKTVLKGVVLGLNVRLKFINYK